MVSIAIPVRNAAIFSRVRAGDTMGSMCEVVVEDPWLARLDRMRRLLPMPLLLVSTVFASS